MTEDEEREHVFYHAMLRIYSATCWWCNPKYCYACGNMKDTPGHELGCEVGRKEYEHE